MLDASARHCTGCARTLEEIARWREMTADERARVIAELPARRLAARAEGAAARAQDAP